MTETDDTAALLALMEELDRLYEQTHGHPWTQMIAH